ncbi:uncharacterized protein A4U43_C01F28740 [Asparagus officinalis]|uniref:3-beta hydroxysteroid dehydrogenase/isomerase domain-containing protein n=1 Tax=Asparagus officinalis TaxID=4686 RepID=A0A5P1FSW6_ASPOF|nr:uncharacterized protein A4U43_C01F28740 [Asparagus officinalis]
MAKDIGFKGDYKKVTHLWELEGASERLQLVKADLMEMGSFDDAVMDCEGVFHTASPVCEAEIVYPAVNGTLNVLRSCEKNPALRRVVLTPSSCAIRTRDDIDPIVPFDESSCASVEICERLGIWYALGKILAEKAAWEFPFVKELKTFVIVKSLIYFYDSFMYLARTFFRQSPSLTPQTRDHVQD